ncbi:MAG TPA: alpha/beta hydrolase-fold protein [Thermoanaerobaculia bacterium]|nr:alpha/beta hydrolase-fold protein [Thermoanaerobaculia bacterium]
MKALVLSTLLVSLTAAADPVIIPRTTIHHLTAKTNGIAYKLYVSLPPGYEEGKDRYPVVYLLDADYSFAIAHNVVEHLAGRNDLRWAILVGIAYDGPPQYRLNRTRDYTPTHTLEGGYGPEYQKHSGGGPKFHAFLRDELLPLIDGTYRSSGERVLVGHSYGGLFASWMLLTAPDLFSGYVVVSPSLWYDDRMMFELQKKETPKPKGRAHFAVGSIENPMMSTDLRRFTTKLQGRKYDVRREIMDDETHNSLFPGALSRGLRWVMRGR